MTIRRCGRRQRLHAPQAALSRKSQPRRSIPEPRHIQVIVPLRRLLPPFLIVPDVSGRKLGLDALGRKQPIVLVWLLAIENRLNRLWLRDDTDRVARNAIDFGRGGLVQSSPERIRAMPSHCRSAAPPSHRHRHNRALETKSHDGPGSGHPQIQSSPSL